MNVVLIGYRGSGKSTVGKVLAGSLSWPLVDTDALVVASAGRSIKEIFEQDGEAGFRQLEADVVARALCLDRQVLSLGGGAVLHDATRQRLCVANHFVVYLRCDATELLRRIEADASTANSRPSLTNLGSGLEEIQSVLAVREPIYQQLARLIVNVMGKSPAAVAEEIEAALPALVRRSQCP